MKKFLVGLLAASMVIGSAISVSAAPVDPTTAEDGALIYTFNFNGEEGEFAPGPGQPFYDTFTATVSEDGTSVTVKCKEGVTPAGNKNLWGGNINLTLTEADTYTFVYKAKANTSVAENVLAVSAVWCNYDAGNGLGGYSEIISNLGNFDATGANTSFAFSMGKDAFLNTDMSTLTDGIDVDEDGFMTLMTVYEGAKAKAYVLSEDGDVTVDDDWSLLWEANGKVGQLGFLVHAHTTAVDTTIKDARIYKGAGYGIDPVVDDGNDDADNTGDTDNKDDAGNKDDAANKDNAASTDKKDDAAQKPASPKTGDANTIVMPMLFIASIVVAGYVLITRKANR